MALSAASLIKGLVNRLLPAPTQDGQESEGYVRLKRYRDLGVEGIWPTDHAQADEGSAFIASMLPGATALQLGLSASFSATAAAILVQNIDNIIGNGGTGKSVALKRLRLAQSVAPTSGVDLRMAVFTDSANRQPTTINNAVGSNPSSGPGTPGTATAYRAPLVPLNSGVNTTSISAVYFPLSTAAGAPPTIPAAGPNARCVVGQQYIKNSIPVVKDEYLIQFGMADGGGAFQAAAALAKGITSAPAVIVAPQHWAIIYLWSASNVTAGNAWDDVSLEVVER